MGKWYNPICYQFYFSTISENVVEPMLSRIFSNLLLNLSEYIIKYIGDGKTFGNVLFCSTRYDEPDQKYDRSFTWNGEQDDKLKIIDAIYENAKAIQDHSLNECVIDEGICYYENRSHFCTSPKALGKKYNYYLHTVSKSTLSDYAEDLCSLLNCPNETLYGINLPRSMVRPFYFFVLSFKRTEITATGECNRLRIMISDKSRFEQKKHYQYQIHFRIPVFLFPEDTFPLQSEWVSALEQLGILFSDCIGSATMDVPSTESMYGAFSPYAWESLVKKKELYYSEFIPGYSWGMLLNSQHIKLLSATELQTNERGFYKINKLQNGNIYFQLTSDIRRVINHEAEFVRMFIKPHLPPTALQIKWDTIPPSIRIGCKIDDFDFNEIHPAVLFSVK